MARTPHENPARRQTYFFEEASIAPASFAAARVEASRCSLDTPLLSSPHSATLSQCIFKLCLTLRRARRHLYNCPMRGCQILGSSTARHGSSRKYVTPHCRSREANVGTPRPWPWRKKRCMAVGGSHAPIMAVLSFARRPKRLWWLREMQKKNTTVLNKQKRAHLRIQMLDELSKKKRPRRTSRMVVYAADMLLLAAHRDTSPDMEVT